MTRAVRLSGLLLLQIFFASAGGPSAYNIFLQHANPLHYGQSGFGRPFDSKFSQFGQSFPEQSFGFGNTAESNLLYPGAQTSPVTQSPLQTTTQDPRTLGCGTPPASCVKSRYRSYEGTCNNLRNPVLGSPQTPYTRLLPQNYGDGD